MIDPLEDISAVLGDLPTGASFAADVGLADVVLAFVHTRAALALVAPRARDALQAGGCLWFAYPKLTSSAAGDLKREVVREVVAAAIAQRPVTQIAIDATWSALRFRPASEVRTRS